MIIVRQILIRYLYFYANYSDIPFLTVIYVDALRSPESEPIKNVANVLNAYSNSSWPAFEYLMKLMVYYMQKNHSGANNEEYHKEVAEFFKDIIWPDIYNSKMPSNDDHSDVLLNVARAYWKVHSNWHGYVAKR